MSEYRSIDLAAWTKVGEGGNGSTYINSSEPDVILKLNKPKISTYQAVKREFEVSKAVEKLGLSIPRMFEMVKVGDAYATISEQIKGKKSLSRLCADNPAGIEAVAGIMCEKGKILSSTPCDKDFFPSRKEQLMRALDKVKFIGKKNREILKTFAKTVSDAGTCSHGDFNMGNLIVSEGRYFWIDLDRFGYGDPMFDIGHLYQICNVYAPMKQVQDIFHMDEKQLHRFWEAFAKAYTGKDEHSEFDHLAGRFACLDVALRYEFQKPSLAESIFFAIYIRRLVKRFYL